MVTNDIINFFSGYVEFTAQKGFSERFINSCAADNIPLWDISKKGSTLTAKTTTNGYKKILPSARKSSMKTRVKKKIGLPFLLHRYSHRTGLIIGFIFMAFMLIFLSGHVWIIEVYGNENLTDNEVFQAFEESGLVAGKRISTLDLSEIEKNATLLLDNASWAAVNINGCTARINVRELKQVPEIETHSGTSNIVASKDGQLEILEVYRGSAAVKTGQPVLEGELLISGITESRLQTTLFTDAYGYAVAKTYIDVETVTENKITKCTPDTKKVWSVYFLGIEFPPPPKDAPECYEHRSRLTVNGKILPFGINYRLYSEYSETEVSLNSNMLKLMALNEYALRSHYDTQHTQIIEQDVTMTEEEDKIKITGKYFCYENIGKRVSFETEESDEEVDSPSPE